jgi:hypothetical protein
MSNEDEYRYLFLVRQRFGTEPFVDSFYQLTVPPGITKDQARVMGVLNPEFCKEELANDGRAMKGMELRMRFNTDIYQNICLVRTAVPITAEMLDLIILEKHRNGTLDRFLNEAKI